MMFMTRDNFLHLTTSKNYLYKLSRVGISLKSDFLFYFFNDPLLTSL